MRNTATGERLKYEGQLRHLEKIFGESIPVGDEAISKMMMNWARGNLTEQELAKIKETARNQAEIINISQGEFKKEEKK